MLKFKIEKDGSYVERVEFTKNTKEIAHLTYTSNFDKAGTFFDQRTLSLFNNHYGEGNYKVLILE